MHQPAISGERNLLEEIALVALDFGRLLAEAGASARHVEEAMAQVATGTGAERCYVRVGYASLTLTLGAGSNEITRMRKIGPVAVNQRLHHELSVTAAGVRKGEFSVADLRAELERIVHASPPHQNWVVALAMGVACAAFGRLLDVDWAGVGPIFAAAALAQMVRRKLAGYSVNVFLSTAVVAFIGSVICGLGARLVGSHTVARDMVTTALLLVPGVPAFNAQLDILEGRPSLGSARTVWVLVILIFMSAGIWLALGLLGEGR